MTIVAACVHRVSLALACLGLLTLLAVGCGGGGGTASPSPAPTPTPAPSPTPTSQNPCAAALQALDLAFETQVAAEPPRPPRKTPDPFRGDQPDVAGLLWRHRAHLERQRIDAADASAGVALVTPARTEDVGQIAVIEDDGTIIARANPFDLRSSGVRVRRAADGAFDVSRIEGTFRAPLGARLNLGDDDTARVDVPGGVTFAGRAFSAAFVNSDGNITFDEGDSASTARDIGRFVAGPPRVAPFFADLDPSSGGRVFANATADGLTVTWCSVPGFDAAETVTTQATVLTDGTVELQFGDVVGLSEAVVGVTAGREAGFASVDLSAGATGAGGVGERFARVSELDEVALARRFFATHPDAYDQLVYWGDGPLIAEAGVFAHEITIKNGILGVGDGVYDNARALGSAGRLESIVNMDRLAKYPDDPSQRILGENTTLAVLAHETGHRWLARLRFRIPGGASSAELLGRDRSHWSFFFDSDASVMEGNDIEDLGGGQFRTVGAALRFSLLDQYAMGLVEPAQVPLFSYVEQPLNVTPPRERDAAPRTGVTFTGTRRDLLVADVVNELGPRSPAASDAPRVHRQAYVYVIARGRDASIDELAKLDRIRRDFEGFFAQATSGRMRVETQLR